ncbi:MAG: hypothetical protein ACI30K_03460 [Muribaculaceae bacterium]
MSIPTRAQRMLLPLAIAMMLLAAGKAAAAPAVMYIVGDATEGGWSKHLGTPMVTAGTGLYIYDGYLGQGQFKFYPNCMPYDGDSDNYHLQYGDFSGCYVAKADNQSINDAYETALGVGYCGSESDYKYYNNTAGYYRLVLYIPDGDVWELRVYKPAFYICGNATPGGWDLSKAIPVFPDKDTNSKKGSWTGILRPGDFKLMVSADDYYPCFNAPTENQALKPELLPDTYTMAYKEVYNDAVNDYKFYVYREGLYTINFDLTDIRQAQLKVSVADEPTNLGAYILRGGDYVVAVNSSQSQPERRVFTAPVPSKLYIYNYFKPSDCQELERTDDGLFSSKVKLFVGNYYKLVADPSAPRTTCFAPNADLTIGSKSRAVATKYNVLPKDGYSYVVEEDAEYQLTVDFYDGRSTWGGVTYGVAPTLSATFLSPTSVDDIEAAEAVTIRAEQGRIVVTGTADDDPIVVCTLAGVVVGTTPVTYVSPGVYVVRAADTVVKVVVK